MHRNLTYALAGIVGITCVAATPFIVSYAFAECNCNGAGYQDNSNYNGGSRGTVTNPFDKPTDGIKGWWGANMLSAWSFGVRFQDWVNSFHQVTPRERWGTAATRYDIPGYTDDRWSVRDTATGGFFRGVN